MGLRRASHVAWRAVGEETILVDLRNNRIFGLNSSGGAVWAELDETGATGLDLDGRAAESVRAFLAELVAAGLVGKTSDPRVSDTAAKVPALPESPPPAVAWQEKLESFAGACALLGGNPLCSPVPTS